MELHALKARRLWILVGTRPEAIKQAPLYLACRETLGPDRVALIGTGQHRELLAQALAPFNVRTDLNLDIMKPGQSLSSSAGEILTRLGKIFEEVRPDWIVVQGDTTSAAMAALAAFHAGIHVAHNEAGLRSYNLHHPFPEEANRKMITALADVHFCPTELSQNALLKEGVNPESIHIVGNTGIDALLSMIQGPVPPRAQSLLEECRKLKAQPVLLTAHRRENQSERVDSWFAALSEFIERHPDIVLMYPMHPNNMGRSAAEKHLRHHPRALLLEPLDYPTTCHVLNASRFVVTDSGGIQEEGATLGVPVVVCRETSERMEAVEAGLARLAGTDTPRVLEAMEWAYEKSAPLKRPEDRPRLWPFGDGRSAHRMATLLAKKLSR